MGLAALGRAQTSPRSRLETATQLTCTFPLTASGAWNKGEPRANVKPAALSLRFESINVAEGTARVTDGFGHIEITVQRSAAVLHFVQVFKTGPIYVTTAFNSESRAGKLKAVHSRHELTEAVLPGFTSSPEQYYGDCDVTP